MSNKFFFLILCFAGKMKDLQALVNEANKKVDDRLLASVLKINRSNKIYKFVSTRTVSISTQQFLYQKGCIKFKVALCSWIGICKIK